MDMYMEWIETDGRMVTTNIDDVSWYLLNT